MKREMAASNRNFVSVSSKLEKIIASPQFSTKSLCGSNRDSSYFKMIERNWERDRASEEFDALGNLKMYILVCVWTQCTILQNILSTKMLSFCSNWNRKRKENRTTIRRMNERIEMMFEQKIILYLPSASYGWNSKNIQRQYPYTIYILYTRMIKRIAWVNKANQGIGMKKLGNLNA